MIKLIDLIKESLLESISGMDIKSINRQDCEQFVKNHYLGSFPSISKYFFGIYINGELIGCIIYGIPVNPHIGTYIAIDPSTNQPLVKDNEVLELQRLFITDKPGLKNIESSVLAKSNTLLHDLDKIVKVVITYADPDAGHVGTIYQATNAIYQGKGQDRNRWVMNRNGIDKPLRDKQLHSILKASGHAHLINGSTEDILKSGAPVSLKMIVGKHRYIYILRDKKRIEPNLKNKPQPYPKKDKEQPQL